MKQSDCSLKRFSNPGAALLALTFALMMGLIAANPADADDANPPVSDPPASDPPAQQTAYTIERDVVFKQVDGIDLKADVYQPVDVPEPHPVVLIVHGGAWRMGDKWIPGNYARLFASHGIGAVSINYRLAPKHKNPAQLDDVRAAIAWIHDQAPTRHWDRSRFGMFGYSAGAHLCSMIGTLADAPQEMVLKTSALDANDPVWMKQMRPLAIVSGGTPADFRALPEDSSLLSYWFGGTRRELPVTYELASPAFHASAGDVPTLFYHGTHDAIVPIKGAERLCERLQNAGVDCTFVRIEELGHLLAFQDRRAIKQVLQFMTTRLLPADKAAAPAAP